MVIYSGECVGGPYAKQRLAHWSRTMKFYRPLPRFSLNPDEVTDVVFVGEYRLNDFGQWHWWPTEGGRAWSELFEERR
jgi:hypothetical protein